MAGRHAAGQTTRRIPLTREFIIRAAVPSTAEPAQPGAPAKGGRKAEYHARHALRRTRRPITITPYAAAAITVTVVGATVGLAHTAAGTGKAGDLEPVTQAVKINTVQAVSRSHTRPSPRPAPSASSARKRIRAVLLGDHAHKSWKQDSDGRVTDPRHAKPTSGHGNDRDGHASDRDHDDS